MNHLKLIFLVVLFPLLNLYSQNNEKIIGEWKVVSADNGYVYINSKTDSVYTSLKFDQRHTNKVSRQNWIATFRMSCSKNLFIFTKNGEYFQYMTENKRMPIYDGTYEIISNNKLKLKVKTLVVSDMYKEAEYYFIDDLLCFKIDSLESWDNKPTIFILEKIK
ncbi:hypothetical protein [Flavobacterium suncheonense]|uniref:Lipocalin-like domain-containing protein n=1 Tax=Flavobacterium suncheonense GH29-5 = DSM 17707 TaxID=1121899 RepID=A0A0A2LWU7_9FLAO|nr:hypothetical protein [Flavobacterium suncheonense]KGO84847.1 hypothetical protein Q764_14315 [Flavobacterium suncheonense GH29-5 = DSM 17707]